jgi:hypothetical protein
MKIRCPWTMLKCIWCLKPTSYSVLWITLPLSEEKLIHSYFQLSLSRKAQQEQYLELMMNYIINIDSLPSIEIVLITRWTIITASAICFCHACMISNLRIATIWNGFFCRIDILIFKNIIKTIWLLTVQKTLR